MVVAENFSQESLKGNPNPNYILDMDESDEETLSFCDLPIYSDATSWEGHSKDDESSTLSEQDYTDFEFFSEDWTSKTASSPPEKIIFCGKLIQEPMVDTNGHKLENKNEANQSKRRSHLRRNSTTSYQTNDTFTSNVLRREKVYRSKSMSMSEPEKFRRNYNTRKFGEKGDFPVQRMSILASPSRSRWYLYAFGLVKFPKEMELRDMKYRQSRRSRSMKLRMKNEGEKGSSLRRKSWKGLWGLVRRLSCGGSSHANAVVKASFGSSPTPCM